MVNRILCPALMATAATTVLASPACSQAPRVPDAIAGVFAYDRNAPLNLRDSLETVVNGVEIRSISFDSLPTDGATDKYLATRAADA